jgi:hypothetical protein
MFSVRNCAILLGLLGVADLVFIPTMINGEPEAPMAAVVLVALLGLGSIFAAWGLVQGRRWARPLGMATRLIDVAATIPAFFVGIPAAEMVGAFIVMVLSLISAYSLYKLAPAKPA